MFKILITSAGWLKSYDIQKFLTINLNRNICENKYFYKINSVFVVHLL